MSLRFKGAFSPGPPLGYPGVWTMDTAYQMNAVYPTGTNTTTTTITGSGTSTTTSTITATGTTTATSTGGPPLTPPPPAPAVGGGTLWAVSPVPGNPSAFRTTVFDAGTNWSKVSVGGAFALGLKTDGTLWAWGQNGSGQLGQGDVVYRASPIQVGTDKAWKAISAGDNHAAGVKKDGTLWTWGNNAFGQLGLGDTTPRSTPAQVGFLNSWLQVGTGSAFTFGAQAGGVWSWGYNAYGQLGNGTQTSLSSPVQVGASRLWSVADKAWVKPCGQFMSVISDISGTLWSTGGFGLGVPASASSGQGNFTGSTGFVSVAALISNSPGPIVTFALGNAHGIALDVKGSVYTWGANNWYQLIDGAQVNYPYMVRAIQNLPSGGAVQAGGDTTSYSYSGVGFAYAYVGGYMIPANTTREWGINRVWNSISVASAPFAFPASAFIFAVSQ